MKNLVHLQRSMVRKMKIPMMMKIIETYLPAIRNVATRGNVFTKAR